MRTLISISEPSGSLQWLHVCLKMLGMLIPSALLAAWTAFSDSNQRHIECYVCTFLIGLTFQCNMNEPDGLAHETGIEQNPRSIARERERERISLVHSASIGL